MDWGLFITTWFDSGDTTRVWDPLNSGDNRLTQPTHLPCYTHHRRPNRHHHPPTVDPTPLSPTWKQLKAASMSRQRRRPALSASDDIAGTWRQFFDASTSAICYDSVPLRCTTTNHQPGAIQVPKHVKVQGPLGGSCPSGLPINLGGSGTNTQHPKAPAAAQIEWNNHKTTPASSGGRFGAC